MTRLTLLVLAWTLGACETTDPEVLSDLPGVNHLANGAVDPSGATSSACTVQECGPNPGLPEIKCDDGSTADAFCDRGADGACGWTIGECPPDPAAECTNEECGPAPALPSVQCDDGSIGGPFCEPDADGTCGWSIRECPNLDPAPDCTEAECGPAPTVPSVLCDDGTVAGPVCDLDPAGVCGWTITTCPD